MPFDIQRVINDFLADPNNRTGLTRAGIGAGVGAAGLGLADAFSDSDKDSRPKDKAKSVLKSMLLGGVLGGAGGAGIHSVSQMGRDPNLAPNAAQYYPDGIRKLYAQMRAGVGTNDSEGDNWAAERAGGVVGALGGIGKELRDWKRLSGEKGIIARLAGPNAKLPYAPGLAQLQSALSGGTKLPPALEEAIRDHVKRYNLPAADVKAAFGNKGQNSSVGARLHAWAANTKDTVKDMFQRNTSIKNWVDPAAAPGGVAAPGIGTASKWNNRLRSWFGKFGPTVEADESARITGRAVNTQNALNQAYNTSNPSLPQRDIVPLTKLERAAVGRGAGNYRPDVRGGTWIPNPSLPPTPGAASTDILNASRTPGPTPRVNAGALYASTPLSRVLANTPGALANPWVRSSARVGGGAALGIAAGYAADVAARNTLDGWLMNSAAKPFVR